MKIPKRERLLRWVTSLPGDSSHLVPIDGEDSYHKPSLCGRFPFGNGWMKEDNKDNHCQYCEYLIFMKRARRQIREDAIRRRKEAEASRRRGSLSKITKGVLRLLASYGPLNTTQMAEMLGSDYHTILESCYYLRKPSEGQSNRGLIVLVSPAGRGPYAVPAVYRLSDPSCAPR